MRRFGILVFGLLAYIVFAATSLYLTAWVGNLQHSPLAVVVPALADWVPRSIDAGGKVAAAPVAAVIDLALILLFGMQHSVMARTGFKAWLGRHAPPAIERSVYVFCAGAMLTLMFWQWRPIPGVAWVVEGQFAQVVGWLAFAVGVALSLVATFLIDHFGLFGLKQVWRHFAGGEVASPRFVTPLFYRLVRHPLYLGFLLTFWGGPTMSVGHLLFAAAMTAYILVAIQLEERDLVRQLGNSYIDYRAEVPMLIPQLTSPTRRAAITSAPARQGDC